mgnify:CR=1 FL=1
MPNHIQNIVTIKGEKEDIKKCAETIFKDGKFSFNNIIPKPTELDIESSSTQQDGIILINGTDAEKEKIISRMKERLDDDSFNKWLAKAKDLGQKALDNKAKYGSTDWYHWCIGNWGTKWDAYEVLYDVYDDRIELFFQTAWNAPYPIFDELSAMFPTLEINVKYADEDLGNNCGESLYYDGEEVYYDERTDDLKFACEVWNYDYDEIVKEWE